VPQCARHIAYTGIAKIIYVEPYPDPDSMKFLSEQTGKKVVMFEGVKARAYERIFSKVRTGNEKEFSLKGL
jgi:deoxycytidylate deaminase